VVVFLLYVSRAILLTCLLPRQWMALPVRDLVRELVWMVWDLVWDLVWELVWMVWDLVWELVGDSRGYPRLSPAAGSGLGGYRKQGRWRVADRWVAGCKCPWRL
jgi:hypothetical protein